MKLERREVPRITPLDPVFGTVGAQRIRVLDVSIRSARIAHRFSLGNPPFNLLFVWDGEEVTADCSVVRTSGSERGPKDVFETVLSFQSMDPASKRTLQSMLERHIERAMDEQKANAYGIPPRSTIFRQTAPRHLGYLRCELLGGRWRQNLTMDPRQPDNGFTISAQEDTREVELLCQTFTSADREGRRMIRQMAEISVSSVDGIATRRFTP
jgi:hypothetical protein